jgi:hypothetical protein|tara:strand:- start:274 stop:696 length:423 start_codon:yes stop_codon:yes gene_type:complete
MIAALIPKLLPIIGDVIGRFLPEDKEAAAKANREIEAELTKHLTEIDLTQAQTNLEQAKHPSIFIAGARPAIMWICAFGLGWQFVFQPVAVWIFSVMGSDLVLPMIETEGLMPLTLSLLGLGSMRSFEKFKGIQRNNMKR